MIRPLRQRHRRIVMTLGFVFPVVFTVGIAARKPIPTLAALPGVLAAPQFVSATTLWDRSDLFAKAAVEVRLSRENNSGRFALKLSAPPGFVKPDLIVYWVTNAPKVKEALPDAALLLGVFHSASLILPAEASAQEGALVLYSLADSEIVDVSRQLRIADSIK